MGTEIIHRSRVQDNHIMSSFQSNKRRSFSAVAKGYTITQKKEQKKEIATCRDTKGSPIRFRSRFSALRVEINTSHLQKCHGQTVRLAGAVWSFFVGGGEKAFHSSLSLSFSHNSLSCASAAFKGCCEHGVLGNYQLLLGKNEYLLDSQYPV